jgi:hypothetical protein
MQHIVLFLLRRFTQWINENPDSSFSRYMLASHGPRTDVKHMNRIDRLKSAISFFLWGIFNFVMLWIVSYFTYHSKWFYEDNPILMGIILILFLSTAVGFVGSLYLFIRIII